MLVKKKEALLAPAAAVSQPYQPNVKCKKKVSCLTFFISLKVIINQNNEPPAEYQIDSIENRGIFLLERY